MLAATAAATVSIVAPTPAMASAVTASIVTSPARGMTPDSPTAPTISIDDVTQSEGDTGSSEFVFTISADEEVIGGAFDYTTVAGSATTPDDFNAVSGTTSFGIFGTSTTVTVTVNGDTAAETDESFTLVISNGENVIIGDDDTGVGSILNDDLGADLSVTVGDDPDPASVGAELTYSIEVSNAGGGVKSEVLLSDDLPNDVVLVSATPNAGSCVDGSTVVCDLGELASGSSATVTIVVIPSRTGGLANLASVTGSVGDPDPSDDSIITLTDVGAAQNGCTIIGTSGDDELVGTPDDDVICGYAGDDTLSGGNGNDELRGGSGDDTLYGEAGYDNLYGSGGSDTLAGGADVDQLYGGGGYDTVSYAQNAGFVYVDLADGYAVEDDGCLSTRGCVAQPESEPQSGESIVSAAGVTGSDYSDTIRGDNGPNKLSGGDGDDVISGFAKHDKLHGGDGTDTLDGGRANDVCTAGETLTHCES